MQDQETRKPLEEALAERQVIAIMPHYWGRGDTKEEALAKLREARRRTVRKKEVRYFDVPKGCVVSEMGSFTMWPPEGYTWDELTDDQARAWRNTPELK